MALAIALAFLFGPPAPNGALTRIRSDEDPLCPGRCSDEGRPARPRPEEVRPGFRSVPRSGTRGGRSGQAGSGEPSHRRNGDSGALGTA
ncbi:hypothetical protein GCM10009550_06780 [Actinocorallia libanotica]|uniref:Secreted protein n=1 Tax=Actinocorallia libanotica TaxID=46162 RepID=A0ABN1Q7R4_9ACTN